MDDRTNRGASQKSAMRKIVWLSFLFGVVAYGVVGYLVFPRPDTPSSLPVWLFPLLAATATIAAFVLPSRLAGLDVSAGSVIPPAEIVGWALAESVAIFGLVSVVLGGPRDPLLAYLIAAFAILLVLRPTD